MHHLIFILSLGLSAAAFAKENLGVFNIDEIVVRPEIESREGGEGQISLRFSSLGVKWEKEPSLMTMIRIGSAENSAPSQIFVDDANLSEDLTFYEGYGQFTGAYGQVRAGLIPVGFGWNGRLTLSELNLHRPLFLENRWVTLRDYGFSYEIEHNHFFTTATVHNGEGNGKNEDGEMFYTASWGWRDESRFVLMVSGQTGSTEPISTSTTGSTALGMFDITKKAHWRFGVVSLQWQDRAFETTGEFFLGERDQLDETEKFYAGYLDLSYKWTSQWRTWLRYDWMDPSKTTKNDQTTEISLAISLHSENDNSNLFLIGTKVYDEEGDKPNDRLTLAWVLRPQIR